MTPALLADMAHNVSPNNAVVARAQKHFIHQNAKRHNEATTIISYHKDGAPLLGVLGEVGRAKFDSICK